MIALVGIKAGRKAAAQFDPRLRFAQFAAALPANY